MLKHHLGWLIAKNVKNTIYGYTLLTAQPTVYSLWKMAQNLKLQASMSNVTHSVAVAAHFMQNLPVLWLGRRRLQAHKPGPLVPLSMDICNNTVWLITHDQQLGLAGFEVLAA